MEQGGTLYGVFQYVRPACGQGSGVFLQPVEENGVFHDSYLYHLRKARAFEGEGLGVQKEEVVQGGPGHGEGAQIVFLPHEIDAVFDAYAGIRLGEGGGGHAQQADAAVGGGGRKARHVQKGSAAHGDDMGMTVDPRFHDVAQGRFPSGKGGFGRLPARYGPAPGIVRCSGPFREVAVDVRREGGVEPFQSFFHQDEDAASLSLLHQPGQCVVFRPENPVGEGDPVGKIQMDVQRVEGHFRTYAVKRRRIGTAGSVPAEYGNGPHLDEAVRLGRLLL